MAHWAKLDRNNIVTKVIVVESSTEQQELELISSLFKGTWVKTSFNTHSGIHSLGGIPLRKNFAGVGYMYDKARDAFIPPKPEFNTSWIIDEETCTWKPPIDKPSTPGFWFWDEETISWILDPELTENGEALT